MDGPAGAGKSTVARRVAGALGLTFLDTGAMYRAVTFKVLERGVSLDDADGCADVARSLALDFDAAGKIQIDGQPGEPGIRSARVTRHVSEVSAHPAVRREIVARQRELSSQARGVVAEGRDTTTVVFPEADFKFFLNASPRIRAERRAAEEGTPGRAAEIERELELRDGMDKSRAHSPLKRAQDAIEIDTDSLSIEESVALVLETVRRGSRKR